LLLGGFLGGSFAGALGYARYGFDTLLIPATIAGVTGVGYATLKHYRRLQTRRRAPANSGALPDSVPAPRHPAPQPVSTGS
jgi:predicted lipid-binding transport protein (Tim44 family)